jgi:hypothetical protein
VRALGGRLNRRIRQGNLSSEIAWKSDPCLLAFATADLDQLVYRVHKFESFRSAPRTEICQRQVEVWTLVFGAGATACGLRPIRFASELATFHRFTNASAKLMPSVVLGADLTPALLNHR